MAGFIYYLREARSVETFLAERASVFGPTASVARRGVLAGPDGKPGVVLMLERPDGSARACAYRPAEQRWQEFPDFWLGIETAAPPGPIDLERATFTPGWGIQLADGARWAVPAVRRADGGSALPQALDLNPQGEWVRRPLDRFAAIHQIAEHIWGAVAEAAAATADASLEWDWAVSALGINYHLGREEVGMLGLLTTENAVLVLKALIDWPSVIAAGKALEEAEKKTPPAVTPDGSNTASGVTDSPPATNPPAPISNYICGGAS